MIIIKYLEFLGFVAVVCLVFYGSGSFFSFQLLNMLKHSYCWWFLF